MTDAFTIGCHLRPHPGHTTGGDALLIEREDGCTRLAVIDVLGHGDEAHALIAPLTALFAQQAGERNPGSILAALHNGILGHRGAAAGVAILDDDGSLRYAGIGNTVARIAGARELSFISADGILGQRWRSPVVQTNQIDSSEVLLMHSDGIRSRWPNDEDHRAWHLRDPNELAAERVASLGRDHDDAACLVARRSA